MRRGPRPDSQKGRHGASCRVIYAGMPASSTSSLETVDDFFRLAVRRFRGARLGYGHGTTNAVDEAAFLILEALRLPIHTIDPWLDLEPTAPERARLLPL